MAPRADEADLLNRLVRQDDPDDWLDAWEMLVSQYGDRVYGLALRTLRHRQDAEDATQAVWQRAIRGLPRFRGDASLGTWLFKITMNVCFTHLEDQGRRFFVPSSDHEDGLLTQIADEGTPDAERQASGGEARRAIERAIGLLDPDSRAAIVLREVEGLRYDEIADVLDIPLNTVKTRIHRARLELQATLKEFRP